MSTVLIALMSPPKATPAFGHLPPVFKFSEVARDRGYNIVWCCSEAIAPTVAAAYPQDSIRSYPNPTFMGAPRAVQPFFRRFLTTDIPQRMMPKLEQGRNNEWLFDSYVTVGFDAERFFFPAIETTLKALIEFEPDFIFTYGCPVGLTAGYIGGVPIVTFDNLMRLRNEGGASYRRMDETVQKAIALYSPAATAPASLEDIIRNDQHFRILNTVQHLDRKPYSSNECFVGGFEPPRAALDIDLKPTAVDVDVSTRTIYAYFGSASLSFRRVRDVLPRVFAEVNSLSGEPYDCYVSSNFVGQPYSEGAVHFAPYFDPQDILPFSTFAFSHGGINTVMQALGHGVPLIMVPGAIQERRHNAREVVAVNAGVLIEVEEFTASNLSSLLLDQARERVLKQGALRTQQLIEAAGGMEHAFSEMEERWLKPYDRSTLKAIDRRLHWA